MIDVTRITRSDDDFYSILGPFFGSRAVERQTHDHFYDDPDKLWYVTPKGAASVLSGSIRNFYAADAEQARALIVAIKEDNDLISGKVPVTWREVFEQEGFDVSEYSINFMEVFYETH